MAFDSNTNTLILSGSNHISQIAPADLTTLKSDLTVTIPTAPTGANILVDHFDQVSVDSNGHLFAAINNGNLFFLDYASSGLVNDASNVQQSQFLKSQLDDLAPLSGSGVNPNPGGGGGGGSAIPLPAAIWPGLMLLGGMGAWNAKRRRA